MSILLAIIQFYFYISWVLWNFVLQYIFPIQKSFYNIFPLKIQLEIQKVYLVDTVYQKKISYDCALRLKNIVRHPSYHERSFVVIEYELKNLDRLSGSYLIILRGNDRESLNRVVEYLEKTDLFVDYMNILHGRDRYIDCQFVVASKDLQFDKTSFFNRLLGIDRGGHHFLYINHELVTVADLWKIICILDKEYQWYDQDVQLKTLDESLVEGNFTGSDIFLGSRDNNDDERHRHCHGAETDGAK